MTRPAFLLSLVAAACAHGPSTADRAGAPQPETRADTAPAAAAGAAEKEGEKTPEASPAVPRAAILEQVTGVVRAVDRRTHTFTVAQTVGGAVTLSLDRNTMVYTAAGLGTVLDLVPGAHVRAGRNADHLAYWVQVRGPAQPGPSPSPGQGTGPGGGSPPPPERGAGPWQSPPPSPTPPAGSGPGSGP